MSNCDFNGPCDCSRCRTTNDTVICGTCGFGNVVLIKQDAHWIEDRHGIGSYDLTRPKKYGSDFACFKCHATVPNSVYFDELDIQDCQRKIDRELAITQGMVCTECRVVQGFDYLTYPLSGLVDRLYPVDGMQLCKRCYGVLLKQSSQDPSDAFGKYEFDYHSLTWRLVRVRKACSVCGTLRWLNVENQWKDKCTNCYREAVSKR